MKPRIASRELLELEHNKPCLLESKFLLCERVREKKKTVPKNSEKKKKPYGMRGKEECKSCTTAAIPTSQVLGKVKDFLGVIAEANEKLHLNAQGNSSEHDIEVLTGHETEYIEMDLMLGVTDLQTPEAVAVAEAAMGGFPHELSVFDEGSSSDPEESSGDEDDIVTEDASLSHGKAPKSNSNDSSSTKQRRKRPKITVLNES